jgi:Carboxypeptidase regulatory-like domain
MALFVIARLSSVLLSAALVGTAQESGSVFGTIVDPGGDALPRAAIRLLASGPDRHYDGQTDINGRFRVGGVLPGRYRITVSLQGFRSSIQEVRISSGKATDNDVQRLAFSPCNTPRGPTCDDFGLAPPQKVETGGHTAEKGACPDSTALGSLKHQIAYQRTEESDPLRGLSVIHVNVWMRGSLTGFYIHEPLKGFLPTIRDTYLFDEEDGLRGGGTCPVEKNWLACIAGFADPKRTDERVTTCATTIDVRRIAAWEPSPNNQQKRRIALELRHEVEDEWGQAEKIVVRDFNLKDNQLTIYIKALDDEQYHGCDFRSMRTPHCDGWHLFGQVPISSIRKWIFARPYELK